jgi:hypothetical protein
MAVTKRSRNFLAQFRNKVSHCAELPLRFNVAAKPG